MILRIGFNPTRSTSPCYNNYTFIQYTVIHTFTYIHKNESKHSEMGPVRQNPIQRPVSLFICVCTALCTIVAHNIAQNRPDNFPLTLKTAKCRKALLAYTTSVGSFTSMCIYLFVEVARTLYQYRSHKCGYWCQCKSGGSG